MYTYTYNSKLSSENINEFGNISVLGIILRVYFVQFLHDIKMSKGASPRRLNREQSNQMDSKYLSGQTTPVT